jgi:hypothetical protein
MRNGKKRATQRNERTRTMIPRVSERISKRRSAARRRPEPAIGPGIYKHQPLDTSIDEIRLLKLRKEKDGPVHCEIEVFPLERAPEYVALSYRWGPPSPSHDLLIGNKALKIRDILNSCLLELREELDTWLWIDQICIAQVDTAERNHQVGMMSRIYSNSASVIVWIGDIPLAAPGEIDHFDNQDLDAASLTVLLNNKYFSRLWIIQEIFLAKAVTIRINGHRSVAWGKMAAVYDDSILGNVVPLSSKNLIRLYGYRRSRMPLFMCVASFMSSHCEDPRDKVYGVQGIVEAKYRVVVDYTKGALDVYLSVVRSSLAYKAAYPELENATIVSVLLQLGRQMQIQEYQMRHLEEFLTDCLLNCITGVVITVGYEMVEHAQEQDYWWYEFCHHRVCYYCPRTTPISSSPTTTSAENQTACIGYPI